MIFPSFRFTYADKNRWVLLSDPSEIDVLIEGLKKIEQYTSKSDVTDQNNEVTQWERVIS